MLTERCNGEVPVNPALTRLRNFGDVMRYDGFVPSSSSVKREGVELVVDIPHPLAPVQRLVEGIKRRLKRATVVSSDRIQRLALISHLG